MFLLFIGFSSSLQLIQYECVGVSSKKIFSTAHSWQNHKYGTQHKQFVIRVCIAPTRSKGVCYIMVWCSRRHRHCHASINGVPSGATWYRDSTKASKLIIVPDYYGVTHFPPKTALKPHPRITFRWQSIGASWAQHPPPTAAVRPPLCARGTTKRDHCSPLQIKLFRVRDFYSSSRNQ